MKKHHKKAMKEGSVAEEAMESPAEEAAEKDGMKRGGKAKAKKKEVKADGHKAKMRLDKPGKFATGGVIESTDNGVTPSSPFASGSPMRGGKK